MQKENISFFFVVVLNFWIVDVNKKQKLHTSKYIYIYIIEILIECYKLNLIINNYVEYPAEYMVSPLFIEKKYFHFSYF